MIDTEKLLNETNIIDIVSRHVELKKQGVEHVGVCPFHADEKASLKVNEQKQIFKCFACDSGGDSIDFIQKISGLSFLDAVESVSNGSIEYNLSPGVVPSKKPKEAAKSDWNHVWPVEKLPNDISHIEHGEPSAVWAYKDSKGGIIGAVCRFDIAEGEKEVLPLCFATNGTVSRWKWKGFSMPRPLYNLDLIAKYPNASIVVVEGEKTADAVQMEVEAGKTVATTWIGGANGIKNADFSPLYGRNVIFWPDNDTQQKYGEKHEKNGQIKPWKEQPGNSAMLNINSMIGEKLKVKKWVKNPDDLPHKWDAADKKWTNGELIKFVRKNLIDVPQFKEEKQIEKIETKEPEPVKQPAISIPEIFGNPLIKNEHFKFLGYDKEDMNLVFYFFAYDAKTTLKLKASSLGKTNLYQLAPVNWWEDNFPGNKSKINIDSAQQFLISSSTKIGLFKEKFIRGRGAWIDNERFVIHTGNQLIVDGEPVPLRKMASQFVYEVGEFMGFGDGESLKTEESKQLIEKINWLLWDRDINAHLLAGWCVLAPFCGVLDWRPHIWVTGAAGSGKSWTMDNIVKRLTGESAIVVQGKTTEAGIRGLLQNDARTVLFDESDVDNHTDKERIQSILALARASSYKDGGMIGKGTQSGQSKTFTTKSCFAFSGIGVQLNQQSDRSRFTTLTLLPFENKRTKKDFTEFERSWNKLVDSDFVDRLQARTIELLPVILHNTKIFADAVAQAIGQRRIGDQVGGMLAGAYSLDSREKISIEDAVKWVKSKEWEEEKSLVQTKDEFQMFNTIFGHQLEVETGFGRRKFTIGEMILISQNIIDEPELSAETTLKRLRRAGILVKNECILIANTAKELRTIIRDTPWSNNHNKILERLPGAVKIESRVYYPGCNSRGVSIPLNLISDGFEDLTPSEVVRKKTNADDLPF